MRVSYKRLSIIVAAAAAAVVLTLGAVLHTRVLPLTSHAPPEVFAFGPVVGKVIQRFEAPADFMTRIDLYLVADTRGAELVPVNLRLRRASGEIVAESRIDIGAGDRAQLHRFRFTPIENSRQADFDLEIERAPSAAGELFVPVARVRDRASGVFTDHDGVPHSDWTVRYQLFQRIRPISYFRSLLESDFLTAAGALAAAGLLALGAGGGIRRLAPGLAPAAAPWLFGVILTIGAAWLAFAFLPAA